MKEKQVIGEENKKGETGKRKQQGGRDRNRWRGNRHTDRDTKKTDASRRHHVHSFGGAVQNII